MADASPAPPDAREGARAATGATGDRGPGIAPDPGSASSGHPWPGTGHRGGATSADPDVCALRVRLGMTENRFARAIGVTPETIRMWEAGHARPIGCSRVLLIALMHRPELLLEAFPDA